MKGNLLDGDDILYVIAQLQKDKLNGAVVGTVMSNLGLEHAIKDLDLNFFPRSSRRSLCHGSITQRKINTRW